MFLIYLPPCSAHKPDIKSQAQGGLWFQYCIWDHKIYCRIQLCVKMPNCSNIKNKKNRKLSEDHPIFNGFLQANEANCHPRPYFHPSMITREQVLRLIFLLTKRHSKWRIIWIAKPRPVRNTTQLTIFLMTCVIFSKNIAALPQTGSYRACEKS